MAERQRRCAVIGLHLVDKLGIVTGVGHHGDKAVVFRRSPDHRRTADINVFDAGRVIAALGHGFFKRVQIDDQQVDRVDPMGGHCQKMLIIIAQRQKPAMHIRMQRLDPPVHHFGKSRHL